jgi:hypothetical protein
MAEVIRYGAGGVPYKGSVGPASTEVVAEVEEETPEEEPQLDLKFEEDDTPLTDEQIAAKTKGK